MHKRALVVGGAACVWDDAVTALELFQPDIVVAVNEAGILWPHHLDFWVTLEAPKFFDWQQRRDASGRNTDYLAVVASDAPFVDEPMRVDRRMNHEWRGYDNHRNSGSSGLFAVKVALAEGATHVVLAGVPMSTTGGHFLQAGAWDGSGYEDAWTGVRLRIAGHVRSMSGWTAVLLGKPTPEWLAEPHSPFTGN